MLTLDCLPERLISWVNISWRSGSSFSSSADKVWVTANIFLPAVDEWASSMITANFLFFKLGPLLPASLMMFKTYGNFWMVVTTTLVLLAKALSRSAELQSSSIVWITPSAISIRFIACCNCRSTTTRSVMIMILSKICLFSSSWREVNLLANQAIVLVFPEPAECSIK